MQEKIRGDEVEVEKLLIVIFINRQRHKMSLEKQRFSEIYKKNGDLANFLHFLPVICTGICLHVPVHVP